MTRKIKHIPQLSIEKTEQNLSFKKEGESDALLIKDKEASALHQVAPLLLDEWKYHHGMFSEAIYRYGLAEVFITVAPYMMSGLIKDLGLLVLFFPALAIFLAVFAAYHLLSLSMYVSQSDINYRKVMGGYAPTMKLVNDCFIPKKFATRLLLKFMKSLEDSLLLESVIQQLAFVFLPLCLFIQIINSVILTSLLNKP